MKKNKNITHDLQECKQVEEIKHAQIKQSVT